MDLLDLEPFMSNTYVLFDNLLLVLEIQSITWRQTDMYVCLFFILLKKRKEKRNVEIKE